MASSTAVLLLRLFTFLLLLVALIILTTSSTTLVIDLVAIKMHFNDVYSYRYMLATIVIGMAYTLLQIFFTIRHIVSGNRPFSEDTNLAFDFYGDKIATYFLATGAAAGFAVGYDERPLLTQYGTDVDTFFNKGNASASLLFLGFICTAVLSIFSSYALPKKV